ncbi:MAG: aldo/keto reductase [Lentisphaeria bacterium]|nr:aldo/keto reductase [Lentisphaeria bacterium]
MQKAILGKTGLEVSRLGFGTMRLPISEDPALANRRDDLEEAAELVVRGIDRGINYIDTAFGYCGERSEIAVGMALRGRRDQVVLSTKLPMWRVECADDFPRFLEKQLEKLDTDHIDCYHFHALNASHFHDRVLKFKLIELAQKYIDQKVIRHLAFSFHDTVAVMKEIIDTQAFESVLCQYNLLDRSLEEGIGYAASKGLGVVIMGPVGGGRLAFSEGVFEQTAGLSTPELALRFVLNNPHVTLALSGMGNAQMVDDNVRVASGDTALSEAEMAAIEEIQARCAELKNIYCTGCAYCQPCPVEVRIPDVMQSLIYRKVYGLTTAAGNYYAQIGDRFHPGKMASACVGCGQCETKCPQKLPIRERLKEAVATFEQK